MAHSASELAPTKKVVSKVTEDNPLGYVVIAEGDFDPKVHKEYVEPTEKAE